MHTCLRYERVSQWGEAGSWSQVAILQAQEQFSKDAIANHETIASMVQPKRAKVPEAVK